MFDALPKQVFAHYKELEAVGLAAPQVTYLVHELAERGLPVDTQATTAKEAAPDNSVGTSGEKRHLVFAEHRRNLC